ncbi:MAG: VCBS repeat-containing protein [Bacteroidota bacterium]
MPTLRFSSLVVLVLLFCACSNQETPIEEEAETRLEVTEVTGTKPMEFTAYRVVDNAKWWWAITIGDVTNDGLQDVVYIHNNANGGYLGYRAGSREGGLWAETIVAEAPPTGGTFASGDLEVGDMDGDGDVDILGVKHTGEWDDAGESAELFYYENPSWTPHVIGMAKDAVKDLSIGDFNGDGVNDLAVLTFDEENLRIHIHQPDGSFRMVQDITQKGLHEGMDVGDLDGDGDVDIVANGFIYSNPGGDLTATWPMTVVDDKWNNQTGDWSANGTKEFIADLDEDGTPEIFISHSERGGYPLSYYSRNEDGSYTEHVILEELPAAHTLQVFDMDLDGDLDVVTGVNFARAVNLEPKVTEYPVMVLLNDGDGKWTAKLIENEGIYNGRVADFEGDGDYDIFRYPNHEAEELFLIENQSK